MLANVIFEIFAKYFLLVAFITYSKKFFRCHSMDIPKFLLKVLNHNLFLSNSFFLNNIASNNLIQIFKIWIRISFELRPLRIKCLNNLNFIIIRALCCLSQIFLFYNFFNLHATSSRCISHENNYKNQKKYC